MQRPATTELHPTLRSTIVPRPWVRGGAEEQPTDHTCLLAAACSPLHGYDTGRTAHGGTGTDRQSTTRTVRGAGSAGRQLLATEGRFWCCVGAARSEERCAWVTGVHRALGVRRRALTPNSAPSLYDRNGGLRLDCRETTDHRAGGSCTMSDETSSWQVLAPSSRTRERHTHPIPRPPGYTHTSGRCCL